MISQLLGVDIKTRIFSDLKPLLESIGSTGHIGDGTLRQTVVCLKQDIEDGEKLGGRFGRFTMKLRILETNRILYKNVNVGSVETRNTFVKLSKIFLI